MLLISNKQVAAYAVTTSGNLKVKSASQIKVGKVSTPKALTALVHAKKLYSVSGVCRKGRRLRIGLVRIIDLIGTKNRAFSNYCLAFLLVKRPRSFGCISLDVSKHPGAILQHGSIQISHATHEGSHKFITPKALTALVHAKELNFVDSNGGKRHEFRPVDTVLVKRGILLMTPLLGTRCLPHCKSNGKKHHARHTCSRHP